MRIGSLDRFGGMPLLAGVTGVVLMLGTVIGQTGHRKSAEGEDLMGGMDMSSGSSMSSMPGMSAASSPGTAGSTPGMSTGSDSPGAPAPPGAMTMPDGSTMSSAAMPMNMSAPKMAASMPGGLHTTCATSVCTVIFASSATGTAHVLGTTAKLDSAKAGQLVLTLGKKKLTLRQGKAVTAGKIKVELTKVEGKSWTVTFTRTH